MHLEWILKYFKTAFKDLKVFTGLGLHHLTIFAYGWPGGWVAGWLEKVELRLTSASV